MRTVSLLLRAPGLESHYAPCPKISWVSPSRDDIVARSSALVAFRFEGNSASIASEPSASEATRSELRPTGLKALE